MEGYTAKMMLSFAVLLCSGVLAGGPDKIIELEATQRLGIAWSRAAIQIIYEPAEPTPENYAGALELALSAAKLTPNNSDGWRNVLELAQATSGGIPRSQAIANDAVIQLAKLEPNDLVIRLMRLSDAAERGMSADERIAAYEHLLQPPSVAKISPLVASRLELNYSQLLRRRGDDDAALAHLRQSVKLDPAFPEATAQFAAYQLQINAPAGIIANALVDAILANPTQISFLKELGMMCLQEGLYVEADMLFGVACRVADKNFQIEEFDKLIAQQMLARWGLGQHKLAADLFTKREQQLMAIVRRKSENGQRGAVNIVLPSTMNAINAMVTKSGALPDSEKYFTQAISAIDDDIKSNVDAPDKKSELLIEKTWLALCVGPSSELAETWIKEAQAIQPLSPEAVLKFEGWYKLRAGNPEEAIVILQPLAEKNIGARLGYALALAKIGKPKEAAKEFHFIARTARSEAVGLFAADQLFEIVKTRTGPSSKASEIQSAVARFPKGFANFAKDESQYININGEFLSTTAKPFESLLYKIDITNSSPMPLAITPDGPIDSRAAIRLEVIAIGSLPQNLEPIIFPIDRNLQLAPNETMSFVIDLERTQAAIDIANHPLEGVNLQAELITNFKLTIENLLPGYLGRVTLNNSIRISPILRDTTWREEALGSIRQCDKPDDLTTLVLFAFDLASRSKDSGAEEEVKEGWTEVVAAWKRLPPAAQAWTLMVLPKEPLDMTAPIAKAAKESQDARVQMSALLRWVDSENDEFLNTISRGSNEPLITVAASVRSWIEGKVRQAAKSNQSLDEAGILGGTVKAQEIAPSTGKTP